MNMLVNIELLVSKTKIMLIADSFFRVKYVHKHTYSKIGLMMMNMLRIGTFLTDL